jgi:chromosome segregation ATPase
MAWTETQWQAAIAELERQRDLLAARAVNLAAEGQRLSDELNASRAECAEVRKQLAELA